MMNKQKASYQTMWGERGKGIATKLLHVAIFCFVLLYRVAAQGDFTSIDCGSTVNYTDSLGIEWVSDGNYVSTGQNAVIDMKQANVGATDALNKNALQTLRYFPGPASKHCYDIRMVANKISLVRVAFLGGNFTSGSSAVTSFSVSLGTAHWQDIQVSDPWTPIVREVTFYPQQAYWPICFQRGASGLPFVNSIEVRPLPLATYQVHLFDYILTKMFRIDCGVESGSPSSRYPDDFLDRIWTADPPEFSIPSFTNANAPTEKLPLDTNRPPGFMLKSAWNASEISFQWNMSSFPRGPSTTESRFYYFFFYFLEIADDLNSTGTRVLDLSLDGSLVDDKPILVMSNQTTVYFNMNPLGDDRVIHVSLAPSATSAFPVALLNGVEFFEAQTYDIKVTTSPTAVTTIKAIKEKLNLSEWQGDPCLPWPYDWLNCSDSATSGSSVLDITALKLSGFNLSGKIPAEVATLTGLTELALDRNNFTGRIPDLSALSKLKYLRLQNNSFSGPIPEFLSTLPLSVLTLDNNLFEGRLPAALQEKVDAGLLTFSAANNPFLCFGGNLCLHQAPSSSSTGNKRSRVGIIIGSVAGGLVLLLLLLLLLLYWRSKKPAPTSAISRDGLLPESKKVKSFSWAEVVAITSNLSKLLGAGGFGDVYEGELQGGQKVAVKVNKANTKYGKQQFLNEVSLLSTIHHRHLVSFIGFCDEEDHEVLIYEYMAQGTLEDHIRGKPDTNIGTLDWKTRLGIILNASRGIDYLHNSCNPPIIHRDIKSANILLNEQLVAKVSDFGISKLTPNEVTTGGVTTQIKGSFGYMDPEYFQTFRLSQKNDVYSFGVVMLEVITGKSPRTVDFTNSQASNLHTWVQSKVRDGDIRAIMDPMMGPKYDTESVWKVTELALSCLDPNLSARPDMKHILQELTQAMEYEDHQSTISIDAFSSESSRLTTSSITNTVDKDGI
ncbi:hypothetical protein R1sor_003598 [Riccia sorocarpa]|uniref:non-specific serine/threonine protein kinase n=1 Tax=Riccia sorocarpa TaxID=122646 RepID=A0ABD3H482_9MARC